MKAVDVNVLVDAFREDSPLHATVRPWLEAELLGDESLVVFEPVAVGFLRVVTHPRIFSPPAPLAAALEFLERLEEHPACLSLRAGGRHRDIFVRICRATRAVGNRIPDAYLASLAIEAGAVWITNDGGFDRFPGLRWGRPQAPE